MILRSWVKKKRFWFCLFLLPLPIHVLPMLNYIPQWEEKKHSFYLSVFLVVISTLLGALILLWTTPSFLSKAKRVVLTIISAFMIMTHGLVFFFITVFSGLDLGSREVTLTEEVHGRTVYVFEHFGLFHIHTSCEVAYKVRFLPLYKTYYSTTNHLALKKKGTDWMLFTEYENIPIEKEIRDVYDLFKKRGVEERPIKEILLEVRALK